MGRPVRVLNINNAEHYQRNQTVFGQLINPAIPVFERLALFVQQEMPMRQFIDGAGLIASVIG